MGCIYRRGKNYWIKYYRHGKHFAESTKNDKMEVAKRMLRIREGEISQGKMPGICFDKISFKELMDDYLTDYKINNKRTTLRAKYCVDLLMEKFGMLKAPEINTTSIRNYIDRRKDEGVSNATINRELSAIKRAFNLAAQCTPPKVSQVPYIPMLKENNVRKGFIEYGDYLALKEQLPEYLKPVLIFAYLSGWRRSEIVGLKLNQVNLRDGIVRLEPGETKNSEGRTLYVEPALLELMQNLHKNRRMDCLYVFNYEGKKIGEFYKSWRTACAAIGRSGLIFHDLRRSAIRNMTRAGISERVAMVVSGHKTRSVFDRYNIVSPEDLKDAARKRQNFTENQAIKMRGSYNLVTF